MEEAFDAAGEEQSEADKARHAARDSMLLQAPMHRLDTPKPTTVSLRIRNLSAGGLMADCTDTVVPGERIMVELRGAGEVTGNVAWARNGRIGVSFDAAIDPRQARKPVAPPKPRGVPQFRPRRPGLRLD